MLHKLNCNIRNINKILQISDIHIRHFKRHQEYLDTFQNLYKEIKYIIDNESIILISGDIVHTKQQLVPEQIDIMSDFLNNLSNIGPTIIIAGNHDCLLNNMQRMDAISPIVKILNHPNLFYLKDTGLYEIGDNVIFSNMSVFDKVENYILAKDMPKTDREKIALYHGIINGAFTDTGYQLKSDKVGTDLFDGFDMALIGDIHAHQIVQKQIKSKLKPWLVYCSSLLQQNHGESLNNHGMLVWNVNDCSYEFKEIKNNYGYITIDICDGKEELPTYDVPKYPRIRLKVKDTTASDLNECMIRIREKYNPVEIGVFKQTQSKDFTITDTGHIDINLRDVAFQNSLISDYLVRNHNVDKESIKKVTEINTSLNSQLPVENVIRGIVWKPKVFKFSNMFSYGEDNIVDFSKLSGVTGLFSSNASGKSSLLNALSFCLFDKCSTAFKASHIMNNRKSKFSCELNFEISGVDYFIKKVSTRSKDGNASVKIDFYRIKPDGSKEDLRGSERKDTSSIIQSYVGTFEDFILVTMISQNNPNINFINLGNTDRKDLLFQFMDMNIFESLHDMASERMKEYSSKLKEFQKRNFDEEVNIIDSQLKEENIKKETSISLKTSLELDKDKLDIQVEKLNRKIIKIDVIIEDIKVLITSKETILSSIKTSDKTITDIDILLEKYETEYDVLSQKLLALRDINIIRKENEYYLEIKNKIHDLDIKVGEFKIHINHKMDKINKLGKLEYDKNCKYCMSNIFVIDAIETKKSISDEMESAKILVAQKQTLEEEFKLSITVFNEYKEHQLITQQMQDINNKVFVLNSKKGSIQLTVSKLQSDLEKNTNKIALYYDNEKSIKENAVIEVEILSIKSKIRVIADSLKTCNESIIKITSSIMFLNDKRQSIEREMVKFKALEEEFDSYRYYTESIKKDGIPYELISKVIPKIEMEINNVLAQVVSFSILLDLDGKNINIKIVYDDEKVWPIELASGMEKFISAIATRVALLNVSNLPRSVFLAIDEGFNALDADNFPNIAIMFDYLKSEFDFILVISHMEYMRDFADTLLELQKVDDFSKIIYN